MPAVVSALYIGRAKGTGGRNNPWSAAGVAGIVSVGPSPENFYTMLAHEDPALWKASEDDLKHASPGAEAQMKVNQTQWMN